MIKILKYMYYKFSKFLAMLHNKPPYAGEVFTYLCGHILINIITIFFFFLYLMQIKLHGIHINKLYWYGIGLIVWTILQFLIGEKRLNKIIDEFSGETEEDRIRGNRYMLAYVLFTYLSVIIVIILSRNANISQ